MGNALSLPEDSDLKAAADDLNSIQEGMEAAIRERTKSERMKVELVANVSHDIKTPLTSIVSYVDILKQEENLPEDVKDYIRVLGEKSERLSAMVQDVFEVSKAASGELKVNLEALDFAKLLRQTLADMAEPIEQSSLSMRVSIRRNRWKSRRTASGCTGYFRIFCRMHSSIPCPVPVCI